MRFGQIRILDDQLLQDGRGRRRRRFFPKLRQQSEKPSGRIDERRVQQHAQMLRGGVDAIQVQGRERGEPARLFVRVIELEPAFGGGLHQSPLLMFERHARRLLGELFILCALGRLHVRARGVQVLPALQGDFRSQHERIGIVGQRLRPLRVGGRRTGR